MSLVNILSVLSCVNGLYRSSAAINYSKVYSFIVVVHILNGEEEEEPLVFIPGIWGCCCCCFSAAGGLIAALGLVGNPEGEDWGCSGEHGPTRSPFQACCKANVAVPAGYLQTLSKQSTPKFVKYTHENKPFLSRKKYANIYLIPPVDIPGVQGSISRPCNYCIMVLRNARNSKYYKVVGWLVNNSVTRLLIWKF